MCGILGMVGENAHNFVAEHIDHLSRRGPDSRNIFNDGNFLSLGATRLAMVDKNMRSDQPMLDDQGNLIVFNGEIYNYLELKKSLSNSGISFHTKSDTEVLLKLLGVEGNIAIRKLQGMFSFAYYNKLNNTITLARDFLGKKPLFYFASNDQFVFSSSLNLVKKALKFTNIDKQSIYSFLKIGYIPDPNTMYKEIKSLNPGETLIFKIDQFKIIEKIITLSESLLQNNTFSIEESVSNAILERISGNTNFALSLSGGIDSSIIALLCKKNGLKPYAYSLGFLNSDKKRYSADSHNASKIAKQLGFEFELVEMPNFESIPEILSEFVKAMEEPNSNPTGLSMMCLYSRISKDGHRMVLTGDGGDEIFGGYARYLKLNSIEYFPRISDKLISKYIDDRNILSKNLIRLISKPESQILWLTWHSLLSDREMEKLLSYSHTVSLDSAVFDNLYSKFGSKNKTSAVMIRDLVTWMSAESNRKLDRVSMYYSLEARSPFQSEIVINSGYREMKRNNFKLLNKSLLLKSIKGISSLPLLETKSGFTSPLGYWLRSNPELINRSLEQLRSHIYIQDDILIKIKNSAKNYDSHNFKILWSLIILSEWFDINL